MKSTVTKAQRVAALEKAQATLHARFYKATKELELVKSQLDSCNAQLVIMTGLVDEPIEEPTDVTE